MEEIKKLCEGRSSESRDDLAESMDKLSKLREEHDRDLANMYDLHAVEYEQEMLDRYLSRDDTQYLSKAENNPVLLKSYSRLEVRVSRFFCSLSILSFFSEPLST
jgi:hypothetical protein